MQTNWRKTLEETNYQIDLLRQKGEVTMTEDTGHWKSERGGAVAYEKFLEGEFHDLILKQFDEKVLQEVIASVKEMLENRAD